MRVAWVCLVVLAGCVKPPKVSCADGRVCPVATLCDDIHQLCVFQDQLDACVGQAQSAPCTAVDRGACLDGVCLRAGCGNGVTEALTETCDDGNTENGDGCSADCHSTETCGNGVVDPVNNESCDDGNHVSMDGCQEDCKLPQCGDGHMDVEFAERCDDGTDNANVADAACRTNCQPRRCSDGIKDVAAGEVCDDGNLIPGDGCTPDCLSDETCPNGRTDFATGETCDDVNGLQHDGCDGQTGRLEEPRWTPYTVAVPAIPEPRVVPAMAYDAFRDRVVLFGGNNLGQEDGETWELVDDTWVRQFPVRTAPPHYGGVLVFDAARRVVVLFGGANGGNAPNPDIASGKTWTWNGVEWRDVTPAISPPPRIHHAMAYDAARQRVVMFGGLVEPTPGVYALANDGVWEWDGTSWTHPPTGARQGRVGHTMTYDPVRGRVLVHGGNATSDLVTTEVASWDGATWTVLPDLVPVTVVGASLVYNPTSGRVQLLGGLSNSTTYELGPTGWQALPGSVPFQARGFAAAVARPTRGDLILFGGGSSRLEDPPTQRFRDTWRSTATNVP